MESPKTLRRPSNWQDFENLCKKLWGEIWECPEIKKNGRIGQQQNGVDIYGVPKGEELYYGIQCKGKSEYLEVQFTKEEIEAEMEKAASFQPPLKKLYFCTTALKDAKIEAIVREKNLESIKMGLFEVHLFSWEDIVDLIDENPLTHDWYVKNQNYKTKKEVKITFENGANSIKCSSVFKKPRYISVYGMNSREENEPRHPFNFYGMDQFQSQIKIPKVKRNLSFFSIKVKIFNSGSDVIEDLKIILKFDDQIIEIANTNESGGISFISIHSNVTVEHGNKIATVIPEKSTLVCDDSFTSDDIFVKPLINSKEIKINCKVLGKDFKTEEVLVVNYTAGQKIVDIEKNVANSFRTPYRYGEFEDLIVEED